MDFEELSADLQKRVKSCKTSDEIIALALDEGYELSSDELEAVSGGGWDCHDHKCAKEGEIVA